MVERTDFEANKPYEPAWRREGRPPRVLVTNDDGIHAPGLEVLERIAARLSDTVFTVAPEINHSGAGHSLTLRRPLRAHKRSERRYSVDGTPTDCVMMALQHLLKDEGVDLVLSGVNHGANTADDVTYSGTIAAAMEATLLRVPAIAFSQVRDDYSNVHWATAERYGLEIARRCLDFPWREDVLINVNFPDRNPDAVRGVQVTCQGKRKFGDELVERIDPRGEPYVWIGVGIEDQSAATPPEGTDLRAVADGYVSVTPIHMDLTHQPSARALRELLG